MYDEPFADSSQIPTYLVSEMTRAARHGRAVRRRRRRVVRRLQPLLPRPSGLWRSARRHRRGRCARSPPRGICGVPPAPGRRSAQSFPSGAGRAQVGDKMHKLAGVLAGERDASAFYRQLVSAVGRPARVVRALANGRGCSTDARMRSLTSRFVERMQYLDTLTYLPDDILTKVDRAGDGRGARSARAAARPSRGRVRVALPPAMKVRRRRRQMAVAQVLHRYVPRELIERPKMGFAVPIDRWLRGPNCATGPRPARRAPAGAKRAFSTPARDPPDDGPSISPASAIGSACSGTC